MLNRSTPATQAIIGNPGQLITAGKEAWTRLNHFYCWRDWKTVGTALAIGRADAMAQVNAAKPIGRRYSTAFHDWLEHYGFAGISKSTRARLLECIASIEAVEAWRATLDPDALLRFNHPAVVLREWRKSTATPAAATEPADSDGPPAPTVADIKRMIASLPSTGRQVLVSDILRAEPHLVPPDLRDQLLRQDRRPDVIAYDRIATRAREITALSFRAERNKDAIYKAAAEILRAVVPKVKPPNTSATQIGDVSAWPKAMATAQTTRH